MVAEQKWNCEAIHEKAKARISIRNIPDKKSKKPDEGNDQDQESEEEKQDMKIFTQWKQNKYPKQTPCKSRSSKKKRNLKDYLKDEESKYFSLTQSKPQSQKKSKEPVKETI